MRGARSTSALSARGSTTRVLVLALLSISCASQKQIVQDSVAASIWYSHVYQTECVEVKGPPKCKETFLLLEQLRKDATVANEAQKIGKLPKPAIERLKATMKKLEK